VHGSPGSWIKFKKFLADKQMLDNFRMIVPDRPGYGFSEPGKGRTLGDQSLLLHSFLQKICEGEPVMAVGHSYGGSVVTQMAVDDQRRFSKMFLLAPALDPQYEKYDRWRWWLVHTPLRFLMPAVAKASNIEFLHLKKELEELAPKLPLIHTPLYVMHGDKDKNVSIRNVDYIKKNFTGVKDPQITILQGGNHFLPDNHYDDVKSLILESK